ncbi:MAG: hypothetical protein AAF416_18590 [Pseudomonadota bacterium]
MRWPWQRKPETRASASGFTAEVMAARESYISGRRGLGELTATVQGCISLWEGAFALADVTGTDLLTPRCLAMAARSLALRGEALFLVRDRLVPASDWDTRTRNGEPVAYRLSVSEAGGGRVETALAGEVLHVRIGAEPVAPWLGIAPLRRASITAELLHALEDALREVYREAPLGSQIVPFPESPDASMDKLSRGFRGRRGSVLLRESVNVTAAGGPAPAPDWRPSQVSPEIEKSMAVESLEAARQSVAMAFGVLPGLINPATTGPMVREAQRHLATWALQPIAALMAEEASEKLGTAVTLDVLRPVQAYDAGGRARALMGIVQAMAAAKEAGLSEAKVAQAFGAVGWDGAE